MATPDIPPTPPKSRPLLVRFVQMVLMLVVLTVFAGGGVYLFKERVLEYYLRFKTGYRTDVGDMQLDLLNGNLQVFDLTVYNPPYLPIEILGVIEYAELRWQPRDILQFPKKLDYLEAEVSSVTIIRMEGNRFNIHDLVGAVTHAWAGAQTSAESSMFFKQAIIRFNYVVAYDQKSDYEERFEQLIDYQAEHLNVTRLSELYRPVIRTVRDEIDGFYFINYLLESL